MKTARLLSAFGLSLALLASGTPAYASESPAAAPTARSTSLLTVDSAGTLWSYSTPGTGKIGARKQIATGWKDAKQVVSADWDSDRVMDIVARWGNGNLTVSRGRGNEVYSAPSIIGNGWQSFDITVAKLNRSDIFPGVIARDTGNGNLFYYPNRFSGAVSERTTIGNGWKAMNELTAVDFDRDGGMDLIARNAVGSLILYRTNGLGGFVSESRKTIGNGWKPMTNISIKTDFAGAGTVGIAARNSQGKLYYYPVTTGRINAGKQIGSGWNGYNLAEGVAAAAPKAVLRGAYETTYSKVVYNHMKQWCPNARIYLNHWSVASGNVYGMMWWGTNDIAIRSDIPASITKEIALHECGHQLQARAYGYNGKSTAVARMKAIYGGTGTYGLEENADCIAAYLSPYSSPASLGASSQSSHWANNCTGYKGTAAKLIIQGKRP